MTSLWCCPTAVVFQVFNVGCSNVFLSVMLKSHDVKTLKVSFTICSMVKLKTACLKILFSDFFRREQTQQGQLDKQADILQQLLDRLKIETTVIIYVWETLIMLCCNYITDNTKVLEPLYSKVWLNSVERPECKEESWTIWSKEESWTVCSKEESWTARS